MGTESPLIWYDNGTMSPHDPLSTHFRVDAIHQKALKRLGISTVYDLLMHLPARYEDVSDIQSVGGLVKDQEAIVFGQLSGLKTRKAWTSKRPISEGYIEDGSAKIKVMWFNQPYMAKMYSDGMYVKLVGKVTGSEDKLYIANPEVEKVAFQIASPGGTVTGVEELANFLINEQH